VLAAFNEHASTAYQAARWLSLIEACIREHPELDLAKHVAIIERNLANPWWDTTTPSVLYASPDVFERAMHNDGVSKRTHAERQSHPLLVGTPERRYTTD
jgi:hypothetical protein